MWLLRTMLVIGALLYVESWSSSEANQKGRSPDVSSESMLSCSRRRLFQQTTVAALATTSVFSPNDDAKAACLQGDLRPICIGIYKIPDEQVYPFFTNLEEFHKYWPDLTYVPRIKPPQSYKSAMTLLKVQRALAEEIKQQVLKGDLEEAGIRVLGLLPQIANGCNCVLQNLAKTKIRISGGMVKGGDSETLPLVFQKLKDQVIDVNCCWIECDTVIGQGLRGELGAMAVTQLTILESLKDAIKALDDFLTMAVQLSGRAMAKGGV